MKKALSITACTLAAALIFPAFVSPAAAEEGFYNQLSVDEPLVHGNLAVYPVSLPGGGQKLGDILTLDEAMGTGKFKIAELEEGAEVNTLQVQNNTGKNVMLLAGEIVRGAKQDRIVSYDAVVPPGDRYDVACFCVEAGRWTEVSDRFSYKKEMAPGAIRATAQGNNDQGMVWSEVSKVNAATGNVNESDALTASYNDPKFKEKVAEYEKAFAAMAKDEDVVGVVVWSEGKIKAGDIFANHDLFAKMWPRLLTSYAMDAALSAELGVLASPATIKMRLAEMDSAARETTYEDDAQNRSTLKAADAAGYELEYDNKTVHLNMY